MVRILVLSFLFKGESLSFVRGLWLLDLINRNIFLWIFSGSALHLMFFDGDWKVSYFIAFRILCEIYIFFGIIVLSTGGHFQLGRFCRGASTCLDGLRFLSKEFSLVLW